LESAYHASENNDFPDLAVSNKSLSWRHHLPRISIRKGYFNISVMSDPECEAEAHGLNFHDILFILFKHKWKISLCATVGIVAAVFVYFRFPPVYESQAKLLVRYVVEKSAVDSFDPSVKTPGVADGMSLINSEVEILTSQDLIMQIVQTVGIERLQRRPSGKGAKPDARWSVPEPALEAARSILQNLRVTAIKETNIISVSFKNTDPDLAVLVLQQLVSRYFDKHLEVHRSTGAFEFVRKETDQLRTQLNQTEKELKELDEKAGIISPAETETTLTAELAKSEEALGGVEAEFAAQQARVKKIESGLAWAQPDQSDNNATLPVSSETVHRYQVLVSRMARLRQTETDLLSKYTPQNPNVKIIQSQIEVDEKRRRDLEEKYPGLLETVPAGSPFQNPRRDLVTEKAQLVALEAKTAALRSRVSGIRERIKTFSEIRSQLAELERKKAVEETNYKYFESSLERSRIDETLDPSRMPNISVVQRPVTAQKYNKDKITLMLCLAIGGLATGMAIALLTELVMDQTVKRRVELETRLSIPMVLSIPYFSRNGHSPLSLRDRAEESQAALPGAPPNAVQWNGDQFIRPFCEAIRDRLILDFELNRMTHRPKLVAVTGCSDGAGASTLAAGLAASLSTSEKVVFVDELFGEKRRLITDFTGSGFDYVIYDLPSLSDTSPTLALAGFMDKVLLVVEAEKSDRAVVKRAYAQLTSVNAKVLVVLNKGRSYGPKWLKA
jgi:polysaccharide biosynthesis transport protein